MASPSSSPASDKAFLELVAESEKNASTSRFFLPSIVIDSQVTTRCQPERQNRYRDRIHNVIGLEVARQLLDLGLSKLILAVRDVSKGQTANANLSSGRNLEDGTI
jgi:hypothetical protein